MVSLFTNVTVELALTVARHRLQADDTLSKHMSLSVKEVMELLEFCLSAIFLSF